MTSIEKNTIVDMSMGRCRYLAQIIHRGTDSFLSISGSKRGSQYLGGGIAVSNLNMLDELLTLVKKISYLETKNGLEEGPIAFFTQRSRFFLGLIQSFHDKWFYRVKVYSNNFIDKKTGDLGFFKNHELRPCGRGYYIQEFDIPITSEGKDFAQEFVDTIYKKIESYLCHLFEDKQIEIFDLMRNFMILCNDNLPWINCNKHEPLTILDESLFNDICNNLLEDQLTSDGLSSKLNISKYLSTFFLNAFSRYDPNYLGKGLVLDRFRGIHGNLNYQATQIPHAALDESRFIEGLLNQEATGKWPVWKRVTFSNDDFAVSKLSSLHFATFEVDSFYGAHKFNVPVDKNKARVTALRLFDLMRYYAQEKEKLKKVEELVGKFLLSIN